MSSTRGTEKETYKRLEAQLGDYTSSDANKEELKKEKEKASMLADQLAKPPVSKGTQPKDGTSKETQSKYATCREILMEGVADYQQAHMSHAKAFKKRYADKLNLDDLAVDDKQFFRKAFIKLICKIDADPRMPTFDPEMRANYPDEATVSLEAFLGKEGASLYRLALKEEMHSEEYRLAVLNDSTKHFAGKKWKDAPAVVVAGPSGSGKSVAAKQAIEDASVYFPKIDDDNSGNYVTAADGGIARETSQIRKLAIQAANNKGYTGISTLHPNSSVLGKIKHLVLACVSKAPDLGIAVPETFSKWRIPVLNKKTRALMPSLSEDKAVLVFSEVEGSDPDNFQSLVEHLGTMRAWKTKDFGYKPLDMNSKKGLKESKRYGASGFKHGVSGSKEAKRWFIKHRPNDIILVVTNDLIMLKPSPKTPGWESAEKGDAGIIITSKRTYEYWIKIKNGDVKQVPAEAKAAWDAFVAEKHQAPSPDQFSLLLPSEIKTASEAKIGSLVEELAERITKLEAKAKAKTGQTYHDSIQVITATSGIQNILKHLDLRDKKMVDTFLMIIREQITKMDGLNPDTKTMKLLKKCSDIIVGINATLDADEMVRSIRAQSITPQTVTATVDAGGRWQYKTNLLEPANYAKIKNAVNSTKDWMIDETTKTATAVNVKSTTNDHQFKITTDTISTKDTSADTFKMMIKTFLECQPKGKMRITALNEEIKQMIEKVVVDLEKEDPKKAFSRTQVNIMLVPPPIFANTPPTNDNIKKASLM